MSFEPETIEEVRKMSLNAALAEVNEVESRILSPPPSNPLANPSPDVLLEDVIDEPPELQSSEALIRSQYVDVTSSAIVPNLHIPVREGTWVLNAFQRAQRLHTRFKDQYTSVNNIFRHEPSGKS